MKLLFISLYIVLLSLNVYSQTNSNQNSPTKIQQYDLHIGLNTVSGFRLGGRILFSKHFSFETSIGPTSGYAFFIPTTG